MRTGVLPPGARGWAQLVAFLLIIAAQTSKLRG